MRNAFAAYDEEVKNGTYPAEEHTFKISEEVMEEVRKGMDQAC